MNKTDQPDDAGGKGASTNTESDQPEVPFGSNEVRLNARQWGMAILLVLVLLAGIPRVWARFEPLDNDPDYRIPYSLSEDYWQYQRHVGQAVAQGHVVVVGDSVIWGEYVTPEQTLSHFLGEQFDTRHFANGGLNGTHPLALCGLIRDYAGGLEQTRVLVHCNLLWMSSPERDLQVTKEVRFNHPDLVPQFSPRIPCYKASVTDRLGVVVDRSLPFRGWAKHIKLRAYDGQDLPRWTLDHPWSNPLHQLASRPLEEEPPRQAPVSWTERGIRPQDLPWIDLDTSLQWHAFGELIDCLTRRGNEVFVIISPLNEHMLTAGSLRRYRGLVERVEQWLRERGIAYAAPPVLPSAEYADASHPLATGYARLAGNLADNRGFRDWLADSP